MNVIYDFLRSDGSIVVNKRLVHAIGLHEAIMFSELLSKRNYFNNRGQLDHGFFFNTAENLLQDTGLSAKQQRKAIKKLEELGLVKTQIRGVPAKKWFKMIDDIRVLERVMTPPTKVGTLGTTRIAEKSQLVEQKGHGNNTNVTILKNNTNLYITLASNDSFVSFYLSCFYDYFDKGHMRVKESDLDFIDNSIDEIKESLGYTEYTEMVIEYFEQLADSNNGNILSFLTAKDRFLLSGNW